MPPLNFTPCLPTEWNEINITRKFRGATYKITVKRSEKKGVWVDGKEVEGNVLPLATIGSIVECVIAI